MSFNQKQTKNNERPLLLDLLVVVGGRFLQEFKNTKNCVNFQTHGKLGGGGRNGLYYPHFDHVRLEQTRRRLRISDVVVPAGDHLPREDVLLLLSAAQLTLPRIRRHSTTRTTTTESERVSGRGRKRRDTLTSSI